MTAAGPTRSAPEEHRSAPGVRLVLAGAVANLAAGTLFAWSLVAQDAAAGVGLSRGAAAGVFATAIGVFSAVLLGLGPLLRWAGPRRLLGAAAVLGGSGLLLAAADGAVALWAGIALLLGAANGLGYGVAVGLPARMPPGRRGTATGLVVAAYAAAPVLLGFVAPAALTAAGWRVCLAALAVPVTGLLAVAARLTPAEPSQPRAGRSLAGRSPAGRGGGRVPRRPVVLLWLVFAGGCAPGLALFAQAVPLAADRHLGPQAAGVAVSALALGNLTGRLLAGWWSDRVGRPRALGSALAVGAAAVGCLAGPTAPVVVLTGFLGSGLAYGAVSALVPAATADRVGADLFPAAYGRVFSGWGIAGLLAPVAGEGLVRLAAPHPQVLLVAAAPFAAAAVAVLLLSRSVSRGR